MPKTTIRPTKVLPNYKRVARTGGTSEVNAVSDQSDASYIRRSATGAPMARYVLATPSIPAGEDVATVVPCARLKQPTSVAPKMVTLAMSVPGTGRPAGSIPPTVTGPQVRAGSGTAAYTYETPAGQGALAGPTGPWSGLLSVLAIRVNDGHAHNDSSRATVYDLWANVYHAARPSAAVTVSPASPVTTTSYPELTATLTALIESWQDGSGPPARAELAYELKVFTQAQYEAAGFDPATSAVKWSTQGLTAPLDYVDGVTPSSEAIAETPDVPLQNGLYRAYARARRNFPGAQWGAWGTLDFEIAVTPPNAPTAAAVKDDVAQRVSVTVTPVASAGATSPLVSVERSADAGAAWTAVRGATWIPGVFGSPLVILDYEAPRATALQYRANVEATVSDQQLVSAWATVAVAGTISATSWNLKAPLEPSLNMIDVGVTPDPEHSQNEESATHRPIGRKYPVIVSMGIGGADASLVISTTTDAQWAALEALREYQGTLFLESPYGWARYIRVQSRAWTEIGAAAAARRRLSLSYLEVEAP